MASRRITQEPARRRRKPPTTSEANEQQMIGLAMDLAQRQLIDGSASSQVITHYLRLGSTREYLEQERLRHENALTQERIRSAQEAERREATYEEAIRALRTYRGDELPNEEEFDAA